MALTGDGPGPDAEDEEAQSSVKPKDSTVKSLVPLEISTSRKRLLGNEDSVAESGGGVYPSLNPNRLWLLKFGSTSNLASPSAKFRQVAQDRDEISRSVPSADGGLRKHFGYELVKNVDWASMLQISTKWMKDPFNMALLLWIACVAVSGAILFLVMTGMLNHALPTKSERDQWFEINNQILNALFTLMCLYQHPKRFHHLVLLLRWKPEDITRLREIYCKNASYKPHEWTHMLVVILLLHLNCFAQYALCGLNLGYRRSHRPAIGVGICLSVAIVAPAVAGLYCILSPLGKDYYCDEMDRRDTTKINMNKDQAVLPVQQHHERWKSREKRFSFSVGDEQRIVEGQPKWKGSLLDLWEDMRVGYLSIFCTFCVFGWNMERLGFGNMYVHIATFILFCSAPFWIFSLAAVNIENETVRSALGISGVLLCVFGLLYGGFWRIQMRKRFKLPAESKISFLCLRRPDVVDCAKWLLCCCCSLAQEVRTADYYDVVENKLCKKEMSQNGSSDVPPFSLLMREVIDSHKGEVNRMEPPLPLAVERGDEVDNDISKG